MNKKHTAAFSLSSPFTSMHKVPTKFFILASAFAGSKPMHMKNETSWIKQEEKDFNEKYYF